MKFIELTYNELSTFVGSRGEVIKFKSYEGIYYVINIEDSAYQQLNSNDSAEETVGFANVKLFLNLVAL